MTESVTVTVKVFEGGKHVDHTFSFDRRHWRNAMSREFAERHGLIKRHNLK